MASGGSYRIKSSTLNKEFKQLPGTSWEEQEIGQGLNGIPINNSYKVHTWNFDSMLGCDYEDLAALFNSQQSANSQLTEMETDPYDATGADMEYGTTVYDDFFIVSISPRQRGLPHYENITVVFQIYVA